MQRWKTEPVRVGSERRIACLPRRNAPPSQHQNLVGDHSRILWASVRAVAGGKPAGMPSFWGVRRLSEQSSRAGHLRSSCCLLWFLQHLWTYRWAPQKCWDKQGSLSQYSLEDMKFLDCETGTPKTHVPCLASLLRQRSHVGNMYGKTQKHLRHFHEAYTGIQEEIGQTSSYPCSSMKRMDSRTSPELPLCVDTYNYWTMPVFVPFH